MLSMADRLEASDDLPTAIHDMIKDTIAAHNRIIFNGNGYSDEWVAEAAEKRTSKYQMYGRCCSCFSERGCR